MTFNTELNCNTPAPNKVRALEMLGQRFRCSQADQGGRLKIGAGTRRWGTVFDAPGAGCIDGQNGDLGRFEEGNNTTKRTAHFAREGKACGTIAVISLSSFKSYDVLEANPKWKENPVLGNLGHR